MPDRRPRYPHLAPPRYFPLPSRTHDTSIVHAEYWQNAPQSSHTNAKAGQMNLSGTLLSSPRVWQEKPAGFRRTSSTELPLHITLLSHNCHRIPYDHAPGHREVQRALLPRTGTRPRLWGKLVLGNVLGDPICYLNSPITIYRGLRLNDRRVWRIPLLDTYNSTTKTQQLHNDRAIYRGLLMNDCRVWWIPL